MLNPKCWTWSKLFGPSNDCKNLLPCPKLSGLKQFWTREKSIGHGSKSYTLLGSRFERPKDEAIPLTRIKKN